MAFRLFKTEFICGATYPNTQNGIESLFTDFIDSFASDAKAADSGWSYDTTHCPDKKPILLTPTARTYAAFLVHRTGAKLMIAHSRYGVFDAETSGNYCDTGFLGVKTFINATESTSGNTSRNKYFGLMSCFIPADAALSGSDFHPEYSIRTNEFYPSVGTKIITSGYITSTNSNQAQQRQYQNVDGVPYSCLSGAYGSVGEWFVLCDTSKAALGIGMKAKIDEPPNIYFIGDLSDGTSFANFRGQIIQFDCYYASASSSFTKFYEGRQNTNRSTSGGFSTSLSGGNTISATLQIAYGGIGTRTLAGRLYFTNCCTDPELFGFIPASGAITNQTFNNGEWLTLSSDDNFFTTTYYANTTTTPSNKQFVPIISWDKAFNGNNVI